MFTGLVTEVGEVERVDASSAGSRVRVRAALTAELRPGDSVAVDGACLTAAAVNGDCFEADVMAQTLSVTSLGALAAGDRVNLELPLRVSDRLGGHIVQGHVDGTARVLEASEDGIARRLRLAAAPELLRYLVERGSVALEGVSLTVASTGDGWFEVSLIPETLERTTLAGATAGQVLNLECDLLAKYVERLAGTGAAQAAGGGVR